MKVLVMADTDTRGPGWIVVRTLREAPGGRKMKASLAMVVAPESVFGINGETDEELLALVKTWLDGRGP